MNLVDLDCGLEMFTYSRLSGVFSYLHSLSAGSFDIQGALLSLYKQGVLVAQGREIRLSSYTVSNALISCSVLAAICRFITCSIYRSLVLGCLQCISYHSSCVLCSFVTTIGAPGPPSSTANPG